MTMTRQLTHKGIYKITNPIGECYVGKSMNIKKRWKSYKNLHCKAQPLIYDSLIKFGINTHVFEIVEECQNHSEIELSQLEIKWYNIVNPVLNSTRPIICTHEFTIEEANNKFEMLTTYLQLRVRLTTLFQTNTKKFMQLIKELHEKNYVKLNVIDNKIVINFNDYIFYLN